jgi:AraC-like DNA-binding protein
MALKEQILKNELKRNFGCSISRFSTIEKMNKAKELLKNPQLPIYQIAEEVGYKNATHFTAAFKRYFGNTPKYFRNNL